VRCGQKRSENPYMPVNNLPEGSWKLLRTMPGWWSGHLDLNFSKNQRFSRFKQSNALVLGLIASPREHGRSVNPRIRADPWDPEHWLPRCYTWPQ
jgi:hypothetical protein